MPSVQKAKTAKCCCASFSFSPTITAALTLDGNGNTSGGSSSSSQTGSNDSSSGGSNSGNGGSNSHDPSNSSESSDSTTVEAPTISGTTPFEETTQVTLSGPAEAELRYTTDGSSPTAESTLYSEAFTLSDTTTVKAIAIKNGVSSSVTSQTFTKGSGESEVE